MFSAKTSDGGSVEPMADDVKKTGYLRKLKTMKKKYFILRMESESGPSRLEYHDSEKKWKTGNPPKRSINLKTCFNINRKLDTKQKFVIALYTKDDSFAISLDSESELVNWLTALLQLQRGGEYFGTSEIPKPNFEHVWQVDVKSRGLGSSRNILGPYRLCLTERTLSLVQMSSRIPEVFEFPLVSIRRCGNSEKFFYMEVGRSAMTGAGELWMWTDDILIAQNMHETILNAMKRSHKDDAAPRQRSRSNEASKPISVHLRRQQTNPIPAHIVGRERADSMPTRVRTVSDGTQEGGPMGMHLMSNPYRPSSMIAHTVPSSPPYGSVAKSHENPALDSGESSMSIDDCDSSQPDILLQKYGASLPDDGHMEPTTEEDLTQDDSYMAMAPGEGEPKRGYEDSGGYMEMDPSSGLDLSLTPPRPESVSSGCHSREPSLASPPSWLSLGARMTSSPPAPALQQPSHGGGAGGGDYLDMASPGAASSIGTPDGYMPMSPVGSLYAGAASPRPTYKVSAPTAEGERPEGEGADSSNGYVPMAPVKDFVLTSFKGHSPQEDEGYLDMNPASHSTSKKAGSGDDTSRRSSGSQSTDICFAEYPLDKVRAYFTPTDEDEPIVRAYSIGSRADCEQRRSKLEVSSDASRIRAFSVGSRVGVRFASKPSGSSAAPKAGASAEDKGKKSNSAPILGTSPVGGSSFLHRIHSTSRSSNQNEDLMEMDFPEGSSRGTETVGQGFWPDGSRSSGGGSSTDSLRRTAASSGSRPRANSRTHPRPGKLETLQSIGEKSSSKSPPSESAAEPLWMSPPNDAYVEMGGAGVAGSGSKPDPAAKQNRHYINMNSRRGESVDKGGSSSALGSGSSDRKSSLPVAIQGSHQSGRRSPADPNAGEYVSINFGRGYPQRFSAPSTTPQPQQPVTVAIRVSSNPSYASVKFTPAAAGSSSSPADAPPPSAVVARSPTLLHSSAAASKPEAKAAPEYVNLQYKRLGSAAVVTPVSASASTGISSGASSSQPPKSSDYAVMSPATSRGDTRSPPAASSSSSSSSPAPIIEDTKPNDEAGSPGSAPSPAPAAKAPASRRAGPARHRSGEASPWDDVDPNGNYAEMPDLSPLSVSEGAASSSSSSAPATCSSPQASVSSSSSTSSLSKAAPPQDGSSRPGSVSSERELNYASLDLAADELERSPRSPCSSKSSGGGQSSEEGAAALSYAKIDFAKSDGLRCARENRV